MAAQEQVTRPVPQKTTPQEAQQVAEDDAVVQAAQERPATDTSDLDELLDEIDSVLEENATEFVAAFVQRGGQ